jgi:signal transduction histidine kinase
VTLRAADRASEIPFLPRPAGIADHFLLRGDAAPAVFRGRDLRLSARSRLPAERDPRRVAFDVQVHGEPFVFSWQRTGLAGHAAALLGWGFIAALIALVVAIAARARLLFPYGGGRLRRRSFQMQLTETLAAAVLIAILGVAVFAQQRLGVLLQSASDQEAVSRSFSVQRVAQELAALDPLIAREELALRLAQAADQLDTDAALYNGGELVAVSRPELAQTGLLPPRPPPAAILPSSSPDPFLSIQDAGPLRYRIVWIRLDTPARLHGPLLLAVPLPADEAPRLESVRAIQRALILGSGSLALIFAIVLPALVARRLAAPVRRLAHATGRIADGDLGARVPVHGTLTELRLLAASVERLVRRIPDVRRKMREEAAADLARRVAHDIKNALAPIGLAADYIRRVLREPRGQDPQQAVDESVSEILDQVERLRRISSEFSALGAPLRLEEVNVTGLVEQTVAPYCRPHARPRVLVVASPTPATRVDPEIVARIVENLLQNAVEAAHDFPELPLEEAEVTVRVFPARRDRWIRIEVEDNGPGVPRGLRDRIFDAAFSTRTRGSGLGLANARRFTEAHGGKVRAGPRADGRSGLLLTVELPVDGPQKDETP